MSMKRCMRSGSKRFKELGMPKCLESYLVLWEGKGARGYSKKLKACSRKEERSSL